MTLDSDHDLIALKEIGAICRDVLKALGKKVKPGVTGLELDEYAARLFADCGARSAPKLAYNFPGHTCISVDKVVAHGIPDGKAFKEGQLVNIDVSAEKNGYFSDCGASFPVGNVSAEVQKLLDVTKEAQRRGMYAARAGNQISDIGKAVTSYVTAQGFTQVAGLHSHGVGRWIHEKPDIPTIYYPGNRQKLRCGDVITVEPFISSCSTRYREASDGWSLVLADGGIGAQFEHSFIVTEEAPIILTA